MKKLLDIKNRGSVTVVAAIVGAIALALGVGAYFLFVGKTPAQKPETREPQQQAQDIGASIPDLNFGSSPLGDLNMSALNVAAPEFNMGNLFTAPTVDTKFAVNADLTVKVSPKVDFTMPEIPTSKPNGSEPAGAGSQSQSAPSGAGTGQSGAPQTDCSQFAMVPSCSYVTDPQGNAACKSCYPNK